MSDKDQYKEYLSIFQEADLDGDGELTLEEVKAILTKHGYRSNRTDEEIEEFFDEADLSGDNKISYEEFLIAMGKMPPNYHKSAQLRQMFAEIDVDGNGEIDKHELLAACKAQDYDVSEEDIKEIIKTSDDDGNGTIDYEEFIKALLDS